MMKPTEIVGAVNFYHADCMEFMKSVPDKYYELCIVDPPYGSDDAVNIKSTTGLKKTHWAHRHEYKQFLNEPPSIEYFQELERISKQRIIWGFNFLENCYERGGLLIWDKKGTAFGEAEAALCTMFKSVRIYQLEWNGFLKHAGAEKLKRWHSTAKPRRLYEYLLINFAKEGFKILDTHGGSMSHARAVHDVNQKEKMNLTLDIMEFEQEFYDKGVRDFKLHHSQQKLF